ncbi:hypothetical protein J5J83_11355 [Azoarcus sp. L1K30]|nr:hypothetical protein [Azoarcus sp. L1K30]MBR0566711.1 hypothetical protein [Azoarcus sp. L1K30]
MRFVPPPYTPAQHRQSATGQAFPPGRFAVYLLVAAVLIYFVLTPGVA